MSQPYENKEGKIPGQKVIELCSCSTELSMTFILLINVKMPTVCWHFNIN